MGFRRLPGEKWSLPEVPGYRSWRGNRAIGFGPRRFALQAGNFMVAGEPGFGIVPPRFCRRFNRHNFMSQHRSLRAASTLGGKRNVLKRFERVELLKKRGQWKDGDRITGLRKTKPIP